MAENKNDRLVFSDSIARYEREIEHLMGEEGPFAKEINGYVARPTQIEMAKAVARAITAAEPLLAEAGTGTGKTFAYLIPALLWGGKVIISTGTKTLQDQLFTKDIEMVTRVLNAPVTAALLKGRANYICRHRLERTLKERTLESPKEVVFLKRISQFSKTTDTGDRADLASVPENAQVWEYVTSTKENCLGSDCPHFRDCFLMRARQEAMQADVVVVNHHLFFADVALKESGVSELLPAANTIIFDEAHQLPDVATMFFGQALSSRQVIELCRDVRVEGLAHARDSASWSELTGALEKAVKDLRLAFPERAVRLALHQIPKDSDFVAAYQTVLSAMDALERALEEASVRTDTLAQYHGRAVELNEFAKHWLLLVKGAEKTDDVIWVETFGTAFQLHLTPLSIAEIFKKQVQSLKCAWIFTSATLAVREDFSYFTSRMGLEDAKALTWPSPFPFKENALLYVPKDMPMPQSPHYTDAVIEAALPLIASCGGGVFILCTTLRAVNKIGERLAAWLKENDRDVPLFVQGSANRNILLKRFREAGNAILVGSQSFWEGVDVKGRALSLVIVDKLPFAPPDDPVLAARLKVLERNGGNPFMDYQIPETAISMKQGAGRLIRDEKDVGVLMICDSRLVDKPYGGKIWRSMPPFARTREEEIACDFLREKVPIL